MAGPPPPPPPASPASGPGAPAAMQGSWGASPTTPQRPRHVLVLDISKSMLAPLPDPSDPTKIRRKIEVARAATYRIFEAVQSQGAVFGLVIFNNVAHVAIPLTEIRPEIRPALDNLVALLPPKGRSAIWDALALGADLLRVEGGSTVGNLVLVTDGWDNMSQRFGAPGVDLPPPPPPGAPPGTYPPPRSDILAYLLTQGSRLGLRIIGIGSGVERDKGVDSQRMQAFASIYQQRSQQWRLPCTVSYEEVTTSEELFSRMVQAFVDVPFEDALAVENLHPDELAEAAASAARALRDTEGKRSVVGHLASGPAGAARGGTRTAEGTSSPGMEVDILSPQVGPSAVNLRDRYGPLGEVAEAYMARDWARAQAILYQKGGLIAPVTRFYWQARVYYAQGEKTEAGRYLAQAWSEAETLAPQERGRVVRRLALLQAKVAGDKETESLVTFYDAAETKARSLGGGLDKKLEQMFDKILSLRGTYAGVKGGGAAAHEALVEEIFGLLQDARLANTGREPSVDAFLDFVEIALAEMR
ncbi:MAG: VWA domain-containing protein [Euryarchaeota archaeon]|nr:VWA domain-containing protein [Euryarchaeota archaeon]MDE1836345.1 VWA domain-containing protein [Euryarchaeota archaeon]MDE2044259.1 VWA domain-containing protein [Thermoplasmata archaeon]